MVKNSTLFFIYDNINKENQLYSSRDLLDTDLKEDDIEALLNKIELTPPDEIIERIFERVF